MLDVNVSLRLIRIVFSWYFLFINLLLLAILTRMEMNLLLLKWISSLCKLFVQWNLSNPTHQGTRELCRLVQDVRILRFYFS